jgi:transcriptional regulator with XRE-family HTH domain
MAPNRRLKQARELRGWSQAKVAEEIGTDATTVSRWERGIFSPTPYFRERLCKLFGKNAEELGLLESAYQPPELEPGSPFFQPPASLSSFPSNGTWSREDFHAGSIGVPVPPSWPKRGDTFSYILHSAAHDQQAHMLWGDAYVRALHGQRAEARLLGEASLSAFERVGHLNAAAIREWLNQRDLVSPPPPTTSATTAPLPILSDQRQKPDRRFLRGKGTGIALILLIVVVLALTGFSFAQLYPTVMASSPSAKTANSLAGIVGNLTPTRAPSPALQLAPSPPSRPAPTPAPRPSAPPPVTVTAMVSPDTLTSHYCNQEALGYRCDLHIWLLSSGRQGQFTWLISSASTLALVDSPLQGSGTSGSQQQITVYIQPVQKGQQLIFTFTFGSRTVTAATTWEG